MSAADESTSSIDRAALLGATLAAVVALTFGGSGPWDWVATTVGLALLAVLVGYYRLPAASDGPRLQVREAMALSAVAALCATLVVATPLQLLLEWGTSVGERCAATGRVAATGLRGDERYRGVPEADLAAAADDAAATAEGNCLGAAANIWLWVPGAGFTGLIFLGMRWAANRRE
jgi:hypothetical protein